MRWRFAGALLLACWMAGPAAALVGSCPDERCELRTGNAIPTLGDVAWRAEVGEVAPASWSTDGLSLSIVNASRSGTFWFVSPLLPAPVAGSFSVQVRSWGELSRFAFLVRERGYADEATRSEAGDTVLFYPQARDGAFATYSWQRKLDSSTHVQVFLRGEVAQGASAAIAFSDPYFGADRTQWFLGKETAPFAFGPRAEITASAPGKIALRAVNGSKSEPFTVTVPTLPPVPAIEVAPSPLLPGGVRLDASRSASVWHPEIVENGNFSNALRGWTLEPHELGAEASARVVDGALSLSVDSPSASGSAWVAQSVPVVKGARYVLAWTAPMDLDEGATLAPVLLDGNVTRHALPVPAGGRVASGNAFAFTASSDRVEIQLRALFREGMAGVARFDNVTLRRALSFEWLSDGKRIGTAAVIDTAMNRSFEHNLTLRVVDRFSARAEVSQRVNASDVAIVPVIRVRDAPLVAITGRELVLDATPTLASAFDRLAAAEAVRGWEMEDREAPGRFSVSAADGLFRIESAASTTSAGGGFSRDVRVSPLTAATLAFQYRTSGDVTNAQVAVTDGPNVTRSDLAPSREWRAAILRIPGKSLPTDAAIVSLRGVFPPNATGVVEFANVTLSPTMTLKWNLSGVIVNGEIAKLSRKAPMLVPWTLALHTTGGSASTISGVIGVLDPVRPYPSLAGGVAARWNASLAPIGVTISLEGPQRAEAEASAGFVSVPSITPGLYEVVARSPGGQRLVLGNATLASLADLAPAPAESRGPRGREITFSFPLASPDVARATLRLDSAVQSYEVPLARDAKGAWSGNWTPPRSALPGAFHAVLLVEDAGGARAEIAQGRLVLEAAPGDVQGVGWIVVALAVLVLVVWAPAWWRRRA